MERLATRLEGTSLRGLAGAIMDVIALAGDLPWVLLDRLIAWAGGADERRAA